MPEYGMRTGLLQAIGREDGCRRLSAEFYARVGADPVLRPLFPGKSLRCATREFAAFLIQFLGGDEEQTQARWFLSLRESHARFQISHAQRAAWLKQMRATLDSLAVDTETRKTLEQFFFASSAYVIGEEKAVPQSEEIVTRWAEQRELDACVAAIAGARDQKVLAIAPRFAARPSVFVGLLARMMQSRRDMLIDFVIDAVRKDPALVTQRFAGKTLLHFAAGAGSLSVVEALLRVGADANALDSGDHTPLYSVANECACDTGPEIVRALVRAGGDVNANGGVTRATALHMAARRGFTNIARTLLECGAAQWPKDKKGDTPLQRALNCRRIEVAELLSR